MNVIVIGGGKVGFYLCKTLLEHGHQPLIIEKNKRTCEYASNQLDIPTINADGSTIEALTAANASRSDAVIAVTGLDQDNLISCQLAKEIFHVPKTVARVNNPKNAAVMKKLGVEYCDCHSVGTIIHMAIDGQYAGHIVISDVVKPHSKEAIARLKKCGVQRTVMLTGDAKRVADEVASELGVDEVRSELLPAGKVEEVEKLLAQRGKNDKLAFVGDGINDAPVLTRADIGIAMGAMGSDAAIEAADVVLMDDDPLQISKAIGISRKCIGIVRQNIVFSLIIKFACLALTAAGITNMWAAIFADVGVMVLAVLNSMRTLRVKHL